MRIIHVNTYDIVGGAARSAHRLHKGLRRLGHASCMLVARAQSSDPTVATFTPPMQLLNRLRRRVRWEKISRDFARYQASRPSGYEPFRDDRTKHGADLVEQLPPCDVINLHWIAEFVDYQAFFSIVPQSTPVVWTLHDMNAFTGGCHYDLGCGRYANGCGACPQLGSNDPTDLAHQVWERKKKVLTNIEWGRVYIVAPSRWLAHEVERSTVGKLFPVSVIPYGVDVEDFSPRDRHAARDVLGVPHQAKVVLFVADGVGNRRKGFGLLAQALCDLDNVTNPFLVSLGHGEPPIDAQIPGLHLGYLNNDRLLSLAYSAADIFVIPSLQDNLPNTVLEAMACGTPVVGFDVGGIPDMVRCGITGLLVSPGDVAALRTCIVRLLNDGARRAEMSINCRRIVVEEYALEMQARRYVELYNTILTNSPSRGEPAVVAAFSPREECPKESVVS